MKATRPNGGYIFHGGCNGCTNELVVCAGCQYMEPDWALPNLNAEDSANEMERSEMKRRAYELQKFAELIKVTT